MTELPPPGHPLGDAGAVPSFTWNGKTYRVAHPTQTAKDWYADAILNAERAGIDAQFEAGWITATEKSALYAALGKRRSRQEHKAGGPLWLEYSAGAEFETGLYLFVWSLLRIHDESVTVEEVRTLFRECPDLLRLTVSEVIPDFLSLVAEATKTPLETLQEAIRPMVAQVEALLSKRGG